jgi:MFS family permease
MSVADYITYSIVAAGLIALGVTIWTYSKALTRSPRDLWFLFIYNIVEYAAYAAMNMALVLWLSSDCGLGDIAAGSYIAGWSMLLSVMNMVAGAFLDTIGIRKTLIISVIFLIISRFFMAFITNPVAVFILGFLPLTVGFAIVAPLVSVAIKRYTTKETAALGFGLFYTLMNIGYAIGGTFFDWIRGFYSVRDAAGKVVNENAGTMLLGMHFSTYQMIFVFGLAATAVSLFITFFIRDGVELNAKGEITINPPKKHGSVFAAVRNTAVETARTIYNVVSEKYFWIFIGLLSLTVPVRTVFFHFHYTFPKYCIRVLGEGAKIGSIYGVLNPVLIVLLVPVVSYFFKKVSSYRMMIWGASISSLSCFIALLPAAHFANWTNSLLGEIIFVKWLRMAPDMAALLRNPPPPDYWPLIVFICVFTIGEAVWSPHLMQFTAEIAPKGKEGTYIALSVLPWFASKFLVGPMSGLLLQEYTPLDPVTKKALAAYPNHWMIWLWIGGLAVLTPIGLLLLRKWFHFHTAANRLQNELPEEAV